jgi:hypothetical protein
VDPAADLARLLADQLPFVEEDLVLAVGPASGVIAERHRGIVAAAAEGWRLFFTTPRHSTDEHLSVLRAAVGAARSRPRCALGPPVLVVGPIPPPRGEPPSWHELRWVPSDRYRVRVLFLGASDYRSVMDWWRYLSETAEVPAAMEVAVDLLTLDARRMTAYERLVHLDVESGERERFARAILSRL